MSNNLGSQYTQYNYTSSLGAVRAVLEGFRKKFVVVFCLSLSVSHWPSPVLGPAEGGAGWGMAMEFSSATLYRFVRLAVALVAESACLAKLRRKSVNGGAQGYDELGGAHNG